MQKTVKEFFEDILEFCFPSEITCFLCGDEVDASKFCLCKKCEKEIEKVEKHCLRCGSPIYSNSNYCLTCKANKRYFDFARSALVYKDKVAKAIKDLKYNNTRYLAKPFAKFLENEYIKIKNEIEEVDLIIPVPLAKERLKERGFNQAELLANELSKLIEIKVDSKSLVRIKNTVSQTELGFIERQQNLENAFKVENKDLIKNKNILLIDDVLTTGSTTSHCSKVLKKAGAKTVYVLTVATTDDERA